jgi:hypothetical protein
MDEIEVKAYRVPMKTAGASTSFGDPPRDRGRPILGTPPPEAVIVSPREGDDAAASAAKSESAKCQSHPEPT